MVKRIGILTSGGDCPGLNAAIRAVGKASQDQFGIKVIGFQNGFRGLVENRTIALDGAMLSGILTHGGTILGTSRDKPHKMKIDGRVRDMTATIVRNYKRNKLDALVCLGGGGTHKNALHLKEAGLNIITLPKTIDNDLAMTDRSFGYDTAVGIVTEALDRLHSTATSHSRIIVVEVMGHRAGWLALEAGTAGGADVVLIPEIPYQVEHVAAAIKARAKRGKYFSIVAVAEGAMSVADSESVERLVGQKQTAQTKVSRDEASERLSRFHAGHVNHTINLTKQLEELTGQESRLTILGHLQRGGTPSSLDRVFATWLGTRCAELLHEERFGVMIGLQGNDLRAVPLEAVAGKKKIVPKNHPLVQSAKLVGTRFGDE